MQMVHRDPVRGGARRLCQQRVPFVARFSIYCDPVDRHHDDRFARAGDHHAFGEQRLTDAFDHRNAHIVADRRRRIGLKGGDPQASRFVGRGLGKGGLDEGD